MDQSGCPNKSSLNARDKGYPRQPRDHQWMRSSERSSSVSTSSSTLRLDAEHHHVRATDRCVIVGCHDHAKVPANHFSPGRQRVAHKMLGRRQSLSQYTANRASAILPPPTNPDLSSSPLNMARLYGRPPEATCNRRTGLLEEPDRLDPCPFQQIGADVRSSSLVTPGQCSCSATQVGPAVKP